MKTLEIADETYEKLDELSARMDWELSDMVETILEDHMNEYE